MPKTCPSTARHGWTLRLLAAAGWSGVAIVTLAPSPVAVPERLTVPEPVLLAAVERRAPEPPPDPARTVAKALTDCPNRLSREERWNIARIIQRESIEHGYDPLFITALVQVESGCSATARGGGAIGLTQLLPSTARGVAARAGIPWRGPETLKDPSANVRLGVHYLSELEDMLDCPYRAVAAYNMGPAPVLHMSTRRARRVGYVRKVLDRYEHLRDQYA
ncbi:transglycosylase SLT domain-containing protein [bacterium]|nr:transglycosylase SLT domain-containing protein [bacterium]